MYNLFSSFRKINTFKSTLYFSSLIFITIRSLHNFAICGESLDLESKYAQFVVYTLLDAASIRWYSESS